MTREVLAPAVRALLRISAALAGRSPALLEAEMKAAKGVATVLHVEEVLLQSYLFLGYPAALNAFALWREVGSEAPAPTEDDWEEWRRRGSEVCSRVYSDQYDALRGNVRRLHPDLERWMLAEGYGKVLGRPGLDLPTRELCIVAVLAVIGAERQLYSHLRGALNTGASSAEVDASLEEVEPFMTEDGRQVTRAVWQRVLLRSGGGGGASGRGSDGPADVASGSGE